MPGYKAAARNLVKKTIRSTACPIGTIGAMPRSSAPPSAPSLILTQCSTADAILYTRPPGA
eukprot:1143782-Pelagomonas_calceolata.AAC.2